MKNTICRALLACAFVATPYATLAHHSHGNYDVRNYTELKGTSCKSLTRMAHAPMPASICTRMPDGSKFSKRRPRQVHCHRVCFSSRWISLTKKAIACGMCWNPTARWNGARM